MPIVRSDHTGLSARELQALQALKRDRDPFLSWRNEAGCQSLLTLCEGHWRLTLGRSPACDVALSWDPKISRSHALLEHLPSGWTIVDDGLSKNGTFVNGCRIRSRERLADGHEIRLGDSLIYYHEPLIAGAASTEATDRLGPPPLAPMQRKILIALCRPLTQSSSAIPATNREIAEELSLSVDAVKSQLRVLGRRFGLSHARQNEKRARLAQLALASGAVTRDDL